MSVVIKWLLVALALLSGLSVTFTGDPIGKKTLRLSYKDGRPITFAA